MGVFATVSQNRTWSSGPYRSSEPLSERPANRKEIVVPEAVANVKDSARNCYEAMVIAISRAHRWKKMLDEGKYGSVAELAQAVKMNRHYLARILRLTLLAPSIVEAILDGKEPDGLSLETLRKPMSGLWEVQIACLMPADANAPARDEASTIHIEARGSQTRDRGRVTGQSFARRSSGFPERQSRTSTGL